MFEIFALILVIMLSVFAGMSLLIEDNEIKGGGVLLLLAAIVIGVGLVVTIPANNHKGVIAVMHNRPITSSQKEEIVSWAREYNKHVESKEDFLDIEEFAASLEVKE